MDLRCCLRTVSRYEVLENADEIDRLKSLLGKSVTVVGRAVYRPSGSLLRVDAQGVEEGACRPILRFTSRSNGDPPSVDT